MIIKKKQNPEVLLFMFYLGLTNCITHRYIIVFLSGCMVCILTLNKYHICVLLTFLNIHSIIVITILLVTLLNLNKLQLLLALCISVNETQIIYKRQSVM